MKWFACEIDVDNLTAFAFEPKPTRLLAQSEVDAAERYLESYPRFCELLLSDDHMRKGSRVRVRVCDTDWHEFIFWCRVYAADPPRAMADAAPVSWGTVEPGNALTNLAINGPAYPQVT